MVSLDPITVGLIATLLGLVLAVVTLILQLRSDRMQRRDSDKQNRILRQQVALLEAAIEGSELASEGIRLLIDRKLSSLAPTFRAALSHLVRESLLRDGPGFSASEFQDSLRERNPALYSAWKLVEPERKQRESFLHVVAKSFEEQTVRDGKGLQLGSLVIPFGVPMRISGSHLGFKANLVAKKWFRLAVPLIGAVVLVLLFFPSLVALGLIVEFAGIATALALIGPSAVLGLLWWILSNVRNDFRQEMALDPEYMIAFDRGVFGDGPSLVRFGELAATAYYTAPRPGQLPPRDWLAALSWRRVSPNGREKWRVALEHPDVPAALIDLG